ncbi:hypothetical protein D8Y22_03505 [Salinadaptatus halalkaliphilus]|uniref:Preprotein translocase subunit TatA n=1 Tax=Salinadaptatus halalkaliphilus TaxID=2419781 RepID=A0A4S3TQ22_9EURY|nr:hypothetical protein [Salinadaptatus halalkaliphilus]THE66346.1 hypothetical protein D8Y22_03505 [Salinadaptatus halalkaliphilus]
MVPLFVPGAPGGPELLIILFIFGLFVIAPLAILLYVVTNRSNDDRIDNLERRVEKLEDER